MIHEDEEYRMVNGEITLDIVSTKISKDCDFIYNTLDEIFKKDRVIKSYVNSIKVRDYSIEDYDIFMKVFDRINSMSRENMNKSYIRICAMGHLKDLMGKKQHDKTKQTKNDKNDYFPIKRFTDEENEIINSMWYTKDRSNKNNLIDFVNIVVDIIRKYIKEYNFKDERLYLIVSKSEKSKKKYIKKPEYYQKVELIKILLRRMYEYDEEVGYER